MGHIGLMPQSVNKTSGYKVQGKTYESAKKLIDDAMAIQDAGVFSRRKISIAHNCTYYAFILFSSHLNSCF